MEWLAGRSARVIGPGRGIPAALATRGAVVVEDGPSDLLVHVASPPDCRPAQAIAHADWRRMLDDGLDQRFFAARAFAAERRAAGRGGAVLFVGSPEQSAGAAQAAAAGALANLTKTLGVEWARDGIRVNTVLAAHDSPTLGTLAAYLLSDYAAYVTGMVTGVAVDD